MALTALIFEVPMAESHRPPKSSNKTPVPAPGSGAKPATMADRITELRDKRDKIALGGGQERIDKQHQAGKLTARERIDALVDRDSFQEMYGFAQHRSTNFGMGAKD